MTTEAQSAAPSPTPAPGAPVSTVSPSADSAEKKGILITDKAVEFAKKKLATRGTPDAAIRLGIKGGGCSGFSYVIQFEDDPPRERDRVYDAGGVRFIVDKKSLIYLAGSALDYEQ